MDLRFSYGRIMEVWWAMMDNGNKRRKYLAAFLMIWVVQMAAAFYFCVQKQ